MSREHRVAVQILGLTLQRPISAAPVLHPSTATNVPSLDLATSKFLIIWNFNITARCRRQVVHTKPVFARSAETFGVPREGPLGCLAPKALWQSDWL